MPRRAPADAVHCHQTALSRPAERTQDLSRGHTAPERMTGIALVHVNGGDYLFETSAKYILLECRIAGLNPPHDTH